MFFSNPISIAQSDGQLVLFMDGYGYVGAFVSGCVVNAIYDIGSSETYVEENGLGACYNSSYGWILVTSPSESYIVPEAIAGKTISAVYVDAIKGDPTFERSIEFLCMGDPIYITSITVTTSDLDFILNNSFFPNAFRAEFEYLDLSACGDNIEFPEEFLTNFQLNIDSFGEWAVIYVSPAVKANYADYDFIQVKQ